MTGNGWNPTNKNRDDWGMVCGYVMMVMVMFLFLMVGNDYNWYNIGQWW